MRQRCPLTAYGTRVASGGGSMLQRLKLVRAAQIENLRWPMQCVASANLAHFRVFLRYI